MTEIVFLTLDDARYGFSLAGTRQLVVNEARAEESLEQVFADKQVGVVVIDERLVAAIDELRYREMELAWRGLLVTLPAPQRTDAQEDRLQRLIRRALGYHVRLQI